MNFLRSDNFKASMAPYLWKKIEHNGLRPGDEAVVRPLNGQVHNFRLERTSWLLKRHNDQDEFTSLDWLPPPHKEGDFSCQLIGGSSGKEDQGRYLLSALTPTPFLLNGQLSYQSFLERGDRLQIAGDEISFAMAKAESQIESEADIEKYLVQRRPLLITGETGTGKGHWVRQAHQKYYSGHPLEHININALGPALLESELFGHCKGSFTGASHDRVGAFRAARNGVLFLDEMDSLPLDLQSKLLVALESGRVRPVGSDRDYAYHCQLIIAFGREPQHLVVKNLLRKDFYFRIKAFGQFNLPTLRDCPQLIEDFCLQFATEKRIGISPTLLEFYRQLAWPGNYRQLQAHLDHKFLVRPTKKMMFDELDESLLDIGQDLDGLEERGVALTMKQVKSDYAQLIYQRSGGCMSLTAEKLKITQNTLRALLSSKLL